MKLGRYLIGLATAGLLTLFSGCVTYKDELARFLPEEKVVQTRVEKKSDLEEKAEKEARAIADKKPEEEKKEDEKEEDEKIDDTPEDKKVKKKETRADRRAELDYDDFMSFFRARNTKARINALIGLTGKGTWDDDSHQEGYSFNLPQVKLLGKFGPELAGRATLEHLFTTQIDHGDPEDHETEDITFRLSDIVGGFGWHFGDKELMGYAELRLGAEYLDFDGPLDVYASDMLIGAKGSVISEALGAKAMLSVLASTGILGEIGEYKGRVGDAGIPIEGDYGRISARLKLVKELTEDLNIRAKAEFDRKYFEDHMTIDSYLGSVGIEGRIQVGGKDVYGSIDFFARRKEKDIAYAHDEAWNEYGLLAQINVNLGSGVHLSAWAEYHRPAPYDSHTGQMGELEGGAALRIIAADLLEDLFGSSDARP